jgi:glyceraldehyde 3-phosphate dehydrogenase
MVIRVGVNGFGRVGRNFFRAVDVQRAAGSTDVEIVAVNDLTDITTLAHLLKYDSVLGRLPHQVSVDGDNLLVGDQRIKVCSIADGPAAVPWGDLGVDVVIESTGHYTAAEEARGHLHGGAKKVVVSATSKGADLTVVMGVNDRDYDGTQTVVSNASCTTNCLAPMAKVLDESFGIERGLMTTIHAYTPTRTCRTVRTGTCGEPARRRSTWCQRPPGLPARSALCCLSSRAASTGTRCECRCRRVRPPT